MPVFYLDNHKRLQTYGEGFDGGEGTVFFLQSPEFFDTCIKIYHDGKADDERYRKIKYMIANPPNMLSGERYNLCWPKNIVFDSRNNFCGFLMERAFQNSILLYDICPLDCERKIGAKWKEKYSREKPDGITSRLKLIVNISSAFYNIHKTGRYVIGDIKPQNIMMNFDGKISILDVDSFQISENDRVKFEGRVGTPEYSPFDNDSPIKETYDRFSMGVLFYEVLFGLNPFVGSFKHPYDNCERIDERIRSGLLPVGHGSKYLSVLPKPHENFRKVPDDLKKLFLRSLDTKNFLPEARTNAEEWGRTIYSLLRMKNGFETFTFSKTVKVPDRKKKTQPLKTPTGQSQTYGGYTAPSSYSPLPYTPVYTPVYSAPKHNLQWLWKTIFAVVVLIGVFYLCKNLFTSDPVQKKTEQVTRPQFIPEIDYSGPALTVFNWLTYLNNGQFENAWRCMASGSYNNFSSGYGNISEVFIRKCINKSTGKNTASVEAYYDARDRVNDSKNGNCRNCFGRYHKTFILKLVKGVWKISEQRNNYSPSIQYVSDDYFGY